jgi:hypothetical protein
MSMSRAHPFPKKHVPTSWDRASISLGATIFSMSAFQSHGLPYDCCACQVQFCAHQWLLSFLVSQYMHILWFAKTLADFEINDLAAAPATVLL